MKKPTSYSLSKIKLLKGGGLQATYKDQKTENGITDTVEIDVKNTINPHPDLVNAIEKLKMYLAKCYGMDSIVQLSKSKGISEKEQDAFKVVQKIIQSVHGETMKKITITGISLTSSIEDDKDKRSIAITGTQLMENNSKTALNSPRIKLNNNTFKFESDIQEIVEEISKEVYAYLFEGKKAQLELFEKPKEELSENFKKGKLKKVEETEEAA